MLQAANGSSINQDGQPTDELKAKVFALTEQLEQQRQLLAQLQREKEELTAAGVGGSHVGEERLRGLQLDLEKMREKLGQKNYEYANLKVDVDRGELQLQKKCRQLEEDLEYEKKTVARLTYDLRILHSEKLETTVLHPKTTSTASNKQTNTNEESPQWKGGSSAYFKELLLYDTEAKLKKREKDLAGMTKERDFYIAGGSKWKTKALKYEKLLDEHGIPLRSSRDSSASRLAEDKSRSEMNPARSSSKDTRSSRSVCKENQEPNELKDFQLNLVKEQPKRDFRALDTSKNREAPDCKQQW